VVELLNQHASVNEYINDGERYSNIASLEDGNSDIDVWDLTGSVQMVSDPPYLHSRSVFATEDAVQMEVQTRKVDVNAKDDGDMTALMAASSNGYLEVVSALLCSAGL
jgi:ankyrin repeat protein